MRQAVYVDAVRSRPSQLEAQFAQRRLAARASDCSVEPTAFALRFAHTIARTPRVGRMPVVPGTL
jgi:hypothetical protein